MALDIIERLTVSS